MVTRSSRHIAVQLVDDSVGQTLASASTLEADLRAADGDKSAKARKVGELVGRRAKELASTRSSSTAAATRTTAGSRPSPTAPAKRRAGVLMTSAQREHDREGYLMPGPQRGGGFGAAGGRPGGGDRGDRGTAVAAVTAGRPADAPVEKNPLLERIVVTNRVAKVVKGGRRFSLHRPGRRR